MEDDDDYYFDRYRSVGLGDLIGKTLTAAYKPDNSDWMLTFETDSGEKYGFFHDQDCCESVYLEDIAGDLADLIGNPILVAEEISDKTMDIIDDLEVVHYTFYKLATIKGHVDLRFCGSSNGYYSVSVEFVRA